MLRWCLMHLDTPTFGSFKSIFSSCFQLSHSCVYVAGGRKTKSLSQSEEDEERKTKSLSQSEEDEESLSLSLTLAFLFPSLSFSSSLPVAAAAVHCVDPSTFRANMEASPAHSDATASTTTTTTVDASALGSSLDFGKMEYGCKHYRRRCKIRAPCCNEVFTCRHCHNESVADRHELPRHDVQRVICLVCDAEQPPAQVCSNCGVNMGEYFCDICKFYDDDTEKRQYHCNDCGICRVGGRENFFHCQKCGSCYSVHLRNKHPCVENSMRHHCPICYEYLFDSLKETRVLKCGHTMHWDCLNEMLKHDQYACPICSKSVIDMSRIWKKLDEEVEATLMPEDYRTKKVWILCNDCNGTSEVVFHVVGLKCSHCHSYNTRTIASPVLPQ